MAEGAVQDGAEPRIAVMAPWMVVTVTVERTPEGHDDIYFNAGGQGFWVARMALALGVPTTLVAPFGGHPGLICRTLVEAEGIGLRAIDIAMPNGSYINDRRQGEREHIALQGAPRLSRHEADDLYDAALSEGLKAGTAVLSGQYLEENLPAERIATLARDLGRNGVTVVADVAGPTLEALSGGVALLKVSHEELIELKLAGSTEPGEITRAMRKLAGKRARDIVVSMASEGALALVDGRAYEVRNPELEAADTSGAGDSMTAGLAVGRARGLRTEATLKLAAAAGALNVTRRGRGTGARVDVEEIARRVRVTELKEDA